MITATKENLAIELREFLECFFRTFDISNETPIDANTITAIEPKISNLTNAELDFL